jgi:VWFA-related protein
MIARSVIRRTALATVLIFAPSEWAGQAPSPPQTGTIKVQAPSVVVDVLVTDRKGQHVSGLKASDFTVFEDDVRQTVSTFVPPVASGTMEPEKVRTAPQPPASPTSAAANPNPLVLANVRFITLVLDMGDLRPGNIERSVQAAERYIKTTVAPEDFVAVYWIDQSLHLAVPFTADKGAAAAGLDEIARRVSAGRFSPTTRKETQDEIEQLTQQVYGLFASSTLGMSDKAVAAGPGAAASKMALIELATLRQFLWSQSTFQARAVFVALRAIAQSYASLPGRKNVVVFSQGFLHSPDAKPQMAAVIDSANRANVAFYIVDASGLSSQYDAQSFGPPDTNGTREAYQVGQWGPDQILLTGLDKFDWNEHMGLDNQYDDLGEVAAATGGLFIRNQNDLLNGLKLADSDLREFYTLVYQPTNTRYDGSFRRIRVSLAARGYHVRYRQGYWAIPPGEEMTVTPAAAQLLNAYRSGSLQSGFTPEMNAALLLAPDGKFAIPVHLALPGRAAHFDKSGENYKAALSLVLAAEAPDGRLLSVHQRFLNLSMDRKQMDEFKKKTLEVNARLSMPDLEPVRLVAILQLTGGAVAIGREELSSGEASSGGLRVTGVALSNDIEPAAGTADPSDPLCGKNYQLFLPSRPDFSESEKLTALFGVVEDDGGASRSGKVLKVSYAVKAGKRAVKEFPAEEVRPSNGRLVVLKQFDLKGVAPGRYSLEIEVAQSAGDVRATEEAPFSIH